LAFLPTKPKDKAVGEMAPTKAVMILRPQLSGKSQLTCPFELKKMKTRKEGREV
jgi:hypothetical protein